MRLAIVQVAWVFLGGGVGSVARFGMQRWAAQTFVLSLPVGTLLVNLIGSFLLGVLLTWGAGSEQLSPEVKLALATGVLGGFTTYSGFNAEVLGLFQRGSMGIAVTYLISTVAGCLVAGLLGHVGARLVVS